MSLAMPKLSMRGTGETHPPPEPEAEQQAKKPRMEELRLTEAAEKAWQDQAAAKAARTAAIPIAPPAATPNPPSAPAAPAVNTAALPAEPQPAPARPKTTEPKEEKVPMWT